jgi:peptidoglycan/xylan/chitin deacetylase (PgdA/CDA1 family)
MNRRKFLFLTAGALGGAMRQAESRPELAITMDDPKPDAGAGMSGPEINRRILDSLHKARLRAALFVAGMRIDNPAGPALLAEWDAAGHLICNHTYSHRNYNSTAVTFDAFAADFEMNEPLIRGWKNFTKLLRYPLLKEGNTAEKRDRFRQLLRERGYRVGHVTVDASDWAIDARLRARLEKDPSASTAPYRDYYIAHIRDRASFYRQLSRDVLGRDIRHTVLIHHSVLNALYLGDLLQALTDGGWKLIDASRAFEDPVFQREPKTIPAGESLVWALAKETGRFESRLRYPGEDDVYENPKMDALGL